MPPDGLHQGDRVRLPASKAEGYLLPLRDFARKGRLATVSRVGQLTVWVEFDVRHSARAQRYDFYPKDLEFVSRPQDLIDGAQDASTKANSGTNQ